MGRTYSRQYHIGNLICFKNSAEGNNSPKLKTKYQACTHLNVETWNLKSLNTEYMFLEVEEQLIHIN